MAVKLPVYMDNHATTKVDPRVLEAMLPFFTEDFGNAASRNHPFGWTAEEAVENARGQIAKLIGATAKEIIFTSGATESNNLAIKGIAEMYAEKGNHIITQVTEHKAVLDTCKRLEKHGCTVTYLPVQKDGRINLDDLRAAITPKTILITIMYANNEIGVIQPIAEIGKIAKEKGIFFHVDESKGASWETGPEMQVLDNAEHNDGKNTTTSAGANYALHAAERDLTRPIGFFNEARIVVNEGRVEHWLNGEKIVEYELGSDDWKSRVAASKFAGMPNYGKAGKGLIVLQDHGDRVWYRNIRVRPLP